LLTEKLTELERRLALVESELDALRGQSRDLRRRNRKLAHATRLLCCIGLIGVGLFVSSGAPLAGAAATTTGGQRAVTRLEAPLLVLDKAGNSVVEISDEKGSYGLTVRNPSGGSVFLGSSKTSGAGLVHLYGPGQKLFTNLNYEGLTAYNTSGKAVASIGARPGGSGFMSLGNPNGDGLVEAGATEDGRGLVRVYPLGGPPPTVIPKFIMGGKPQQ
jgi:hypothetical protein